MASLALDFLEGALPTVGAVGGAALGEVADPFGGAIVGAGLGSAAGKFAENKLQHKDATSGVVGAGIGGALGEGVGQVAGGLAEGLAPGLAESTSLVGRTAAGAIKGGAAGAAANPIVSVAGGQKPTGKNLALDFLQGAAFGGVSGGLSADLNPQSNLISDEIAQKLAKTDSPKTAQETLEPIVGPVVAKDLAQHIAEQKDPAIIKNMVNNDLAKKLPTPQPEPTTPQSDEQSLAASAPSTQRGRAPGDIQSLEQSGQQLSPGDVNKEPQINAAPAAEKPFLNAPGENNTTHVSRLAGMEAMRDDLNQGTPLEETIRKYMDTTGDTWREAQDAYQSVQEEKGTQPGMANSQKNPRFEEGSKLVNNVQKGDAQQPVINARAVSNAIARESNNTLKIIDQLDEHDIKLMDNLRGNDPQTLAKSAHNPEIFMEAANSVKAANDLTHGIGAGMLGQDVTYRENYGAPMLFDNTPEGEGKVNAALAKMQSSPGYGKQRTFNNYDEAASFGAQRRFNDFRDDFSYDMNRRANDLSQMTMAKGFDEAYPGKVSVGRQLTDENGAPYKNLLIPGGEKIFLPGDVANKVNERAPAPTATGGWKTYDDFNGAWKNLKLAGGGFHSINTLGNWFGQQIASGQIFRHPEDSTNVIRSMFDKNFMNQQVSEWDKGGQTLLEDQAGLKANIHNTEGDIGGVNGKLGNIPVLKQIHEAVFGRQIPFMMKQMFHQQTENLDPSSPEDQAKMVTIAKQINQQFGAFNRDIQGVTPRTAKLAGRGVLAWDWNEGQVRTLADAISKGGTEGKLARQTVFGKALLFGAIATAAGGAGGEFKGKKPDQVALDILQKTVNPSFQFGNYTVGLPTTQLSEAGKPIAQTVSNAVSGKSLTNPLKDTLSARLAAIPSGVEQFSQNRNFAGNPIRGTDYYGRPIGIGSTLENILGMATPIPATQAMQAGQGEENAGAAIANTAGLSARPTYDLSYAPLAGQTYVAALQQQGAPKAQIQSDTQFFNLLGTLSTARKQALKGAITDLGKKDTAKAEKDIAKYNAKLATTLQPWLQAGGPKYLDSTMLQQLRTSTITLSSANKSARTNIRENPTAYGLPLSASSLDVQAAASVANNKNSSNNST